LRKLDEGQYDAIVLAAAGLRRLGWADRIREIIPIETMCPAVGQGALGIETRSDGGEAQKLVAKLDNPLTRAAVSAGRALLATLGGGCQVPIGGHARVESGSVRLRAIVASPDGSRIIRGELSGADPESIGRRLGAQLLDQGASEILKE